MPEATKIQAQTTGEDSALIETGIHNCLFKKRPHSAVTDYAIQEKKYIFRPSITTGAEIVAELHKEGTLVRNVTLVLRAPALTGLVTGAPTYARFGDFGGLLALNRDVPITFEYGSTTVHRIYPDQIYSDYFYCNNEDRATKENLFVGEKTPAERNTLALAPQEFRIPIPVPWEGWGNELRIASLASNLRIRFPLASAKSMIQTDGVKPDTFNYSEAYLRYELIHLPGVDREEIVADTFSQQGEFTLFTDVIRKDFVIPADAMFNAQDIHGYGIDLKDATGAVRSISAFLRESTAFDQNAANPTQYEINPTYLKNLTFSIRANDRVLYEDTRPNFEQVEQVSKLYGCAPDIGQAHAHWDELPSETHLSSGHISLANFSSSTFYLRSAVSHPELRITLLIKRWNWTNQKNGNYQRIWN
jgi:hypothetical protein